MEVITVKEVFDTGMDSNYQYYPRLDDANNQDDYYRILVVQRLPESVIRFYKEGHKYGFEYEAVYGKNSYYLKPEDLLYMIPSYSFLQRQSSELLALLKEVMSIPGDEWYYATDLHTRIEGVINGNNHN